jgi:ribosome recycling factor
MEMVQESLTDAKQRMDGAVSSLRKELAGVRTNRATPALVENMDIDYFGTRMPLNQLAQVSAGDGRLLVIQPWDQSAVQIIARAIQASDLGMSPQVDTDRIRINVPPMTEERRRDVVKMVRTRTEEAKISVRNVRKDVREFIRAMEKDGDIGQDESKRAQEQLQKLTDDAVGSIEESSLAKETEVMQV